MGRRKQKQPAEENEDDSDEGGQKAQAQRRPRRRRDQSQSDDEQAAPTAAATRGDLLPVEAQGAADPAGPRRRDQQEAGGGRDDVQVQDSEAAAPRRRRRDKSQSHDDEDQDTSAPRRRRDKSQSHDDEEDQGTSAPRRRRDKSQSHDESDSEPADTPLAAAAPASAAKVKCYVCGRRGHTRAQCPGLSDGGSAQSKFKGKFSKLPKDKVQEKSSSAAPDPWWPALSAEIPVADWCCRLHRLFDKAKHHGTFSQLLQARELFYPKLLSFLLCVMDEPSVLIGGEASPMYRFWERETLGLEADDRLRLAFGLQPQYAGSWNEELRETLSQLLQHPKAVAVGVTGLDFSREEATRRPQIEAFLAQLKLAREHGCVVLVTVAGGAEKELAAGLKRELLPDHPVLLVNYRGDDPDWVLK
jgi:hypothetical protein